MKSRLRMFCSLAIITGLAMAAGLLAGCSQAKKEKVEEVKEPYKIGAIFAVTGRAAPLGEPEKETAEMLIAQINEAGGINGHKIELIVEDDEGDETKSLMAAKKLIEKDQVLAVVGTTTSGTTLAIMKTFEEAQTPLVSCAASVKIVEPVNKWVFKTPQSDRDAVLKILEYLEKQGINKIAFINDSNAYGVSGKIEIEALAPQRGMEIVAKETFGGEDTDMTPQLTRIKGTKAQAVICWGTNPGPAIVARNMKQLKMSIPLIQSHGVANAKFIELAGDAAEGVLLPSGRLIVAEQLPDGHPQKQMLVDYKTAYTAKYNKPVSTFGGHAYDAIKILAGALERAGADKAKIRDEIENTKNFVGTAGIFNYSAEDHYGLDLSAFSMVEIKGGQWQLLSE